MKKYLFIIATAAIVASCSKTDSFKDTQESPIDFTGVFVEKNTKGVISSASDLHTPGFGVFGAKTTSTGVSQVFGQLSTETAGGTKVSYSSSAWTYTQKRYWDQEATRYDFFAYAPYNTSSLIGTIGWTASSPTTSFTITGFKQSTTVANMVDILTATADRLKGNYTNTVDFTFSHILSNICIKMAVSADLKADQTDNPVSVTSVTLGAIKMDGSYSYNTTASKYEWNNSSQTTSPHTFTANNKTGKTVVFEGGDLPSIATSTTGTDVSGLVDLLFVPQTLPTADGSKYAINVTYKIAEESFSKTIYLNQFTKEGENNTTVASSEWKPGYKYNYVLVIGPTPIEFGDPTIGSWTEETYTYTIQ